MKILVVSDTHGQMKQIDEVIKKTKPFDYLIHAGDTEGQENRIAREAGCEACFVRGNNDYYSDLPRDAVIELFGHRIYVTHGHYLGVSMGTERLREMARAEECDIVVYGHTHRPVIDQSEEGLTVLNPGSLAYPRQEGREPSYITIDIDRFGEAHYTLNYLRRGPSAKKPRFFF